MTDASRERILIWQGNSAISEMTHFTVARAGFQTQICKDVKEVIREVNVGVGALIVARENLQPETLSYLGESLQDQPAWSHIPVMLMLDSENEEDEAAKVIASLESHANVTLLDSKVRQGPLVSALRAAISYRRRQYEVCDLLEKLESSHEAAVEANRAKSDFLANMSHEIRTPLGAILGFAELLMEPGVSEREKQVYMTAVKRNGQMLSALIDDILDLAKVESGRIEIERIEFSLQELMAEIVSALEPKASKKGLPLIVQRSPGVPDMVSTDPIRLKQVIMNLLGNAIKFTSHGSVTLRVDAVPTSSGETDLNFEIEDTGVGISPRQMERLFKPFTQADTSTTRRFGGTGLGLVLSQKTARAMGGDVALKWSIPGGGSCFQISVRARVATKAVVEERQSAKGAGELPLDGANILVVDDSLDNQMLISRILKLLGSNVDLANDGEEAVEMALANKYDVVLMDLQMPKLGGVEATRVLRAKGYTTPIVALTAHALKEDRQLCLNVGCTEYLTKPIQRAHLVQVLERVARTNHMVQ